MKKIQVTMYQCEYCNKIFETRNECKWHEDERHKCPNCEHSYYVYGCELNCERLNENKPCRFKKKVIEGVDLINNKIGELHI